MPLLHQLTVVESKVSAMIPASAEALLAQSARRYRILAIFHATALSSRRGGEGCGSVSGFPRGDEGRRGPPADTASRFSSDTSTPLGLAPDPGRATGSGDSSDSKGGRGTLGTEARDNEGEEADGGALARAMEDLGGRTSIVSASSAAHTRLPPCRSGDRGPFELSCWIRLRRPVAKAAIPGPAESELRRPAGAPAHVAAVDDDETLPGPEAATENVLRCLRTRSRTV